jgi:hypothetical protein
MVSGIRLAGKVGTFALMASAMLALPGRADAVNLNTSGTACNPWNAGEANDIDYVANGVRTGVNVTSTRHVICPVARSPLSSSQEFFLDGSNDAGKFTLGTLYAHDFNGTFQASQNFSSGPGTYDILLTLNPVGTWSYISTLVTLPSNAGGVYFGTITMQ